MFWPVGSLHPLQAFRACRDLAIEAKVLLVEACQSYAFDTIHECIEFNIL